jgi:hypothetical protein
LPFAPTHATFSRGEGKSRRFYPHLPNLPYPASASPTCRGVVGSAAPAGPVKHGAAALAPADPGVAGRASPSCGGSKLGVVAGRTTGRDYRKGKRSRPAAAHGRSLRRARFAQAFRERSGRRLAAAPEGGNATRWRKSRPERCARRKTADGTPWPRAHFIFTHSAERGRGVPAS